MKTGPNKTKAWRKISRQRDPEDGHLVRYGRKFKNAMTQMRTGAGVSPIIIKLMKSGGIPTPIFDTHMQVAYNNLSAQAVGENDVTDVDSVMVNNNNEKPHENIQVNQ